MAEPMFVDDAEAVLRERAAGFGGDDDDTQAASGAVLDELARLRAELDRLYGIEQRASMAAGDDEPRMPSGDPSPFQAVITARYILRGDAL